MEEMNIFYLGDIVSVIDKIDTTIFNIATVKFIEKDNEFKDLFWLYLVANEETLNDKFDPNVGEYWQIIESNSPYIEIISRAVM